MILLWLAHTVKKLGLYSPSIAVLLGQIRNTFPVAKYQHSKHWKIIHIPSLVTQILENKFLVKWNQNKSCPSRGLRKITYHHINYGVIQGFPALRKTITTHVKKKNKIFSHVFDNVNQLLTHHLLFVPFTQVDKWMAKLSPFPIQGHLLEFSRIMAVKTLKNLYCLQEVTFNHFIEGMENQNTKRKTKTCIFSGFGNDISCHWQRTSTAGRFATGQFFPKGQSQ